MSSALPALPQQKRLRDFGVCFAGARTHRHGPACVFHTGSSAASDLPFFPPFFLGITFPQFTFLQAYEPLGGRHHLTRQLL